MPADANSDGVAVQKEESKFSKLMRFKNNLFIVFNFVYILAYMAYTAITLVGENAEIAWLPYVLGGFIVVYMVLFIVSVAVAKNDRRKQNSVKNYKSGLKIVKKLLKLVNLLLAIAIVVNTVQSDKSLFSFILSCVSVVFVLIQIILEIRKIIKRRKKLIMKEKKEDCDKRFIDDVKNIWKGEDKTDEVQSGLTEVVADGNAAEIAAAENTSAVTCQPACENTQNVPSVVEDKPVEVETVEKPVKKPSRIKELSKAAEKKISDVKKSATDKVEAVKSTAEKAKKITARAKEYYGERKKIEEEMSGKKKKTAKKDEKKQ